MSKMSYLEVALQLFFFSSLKWCVYVHEHQCVFNSAALGKGNWKIHEAVAKGKKLQGGGKCILRSSLPPCSWADGHSGIQLLFAVGMDFTQILPLWLVLPFLLVW